MRLVSKLKHNGHCIIGDDAFSSVQLSMDLKKGACPGLRVPNANHTGAQAMKKQKKNDAGNFHCKFQEYKNLPTESWGRIKKHAHE